MKIKETYDNGILIRHWFRWYRYDGFKYLHRLVKKSPKKKK